MIIATAGHVDHGKTSLVRALTGVDTDTLAEEKRRGISIDLGFAHWRPPPSGRALPPDAGSSDDAGSGDDADSGDDTGIDVDAGADRSVHFVDVPGHERFVRNLLAGVGGVDAALLTVALDDGPMPQTVEHIRILSALGIDEVVVALTKADLVDAGRIEEVAAAVSGLLADAGLRGAGTFACSTLTGQGIEPLALALAALPARRAADAAERLFRMPVDRSFLVPGDGLVVTGSVTSGRVRVGELVCIGPRGLEARVRGMHRSGHRVDESRAGDRCALNLAGAQIDRDSAGRGDWVVAPAAVAPASVLEVEVLRCFDPGALRNHRRASLHLGSADLGVTMTVIRAPDADGRDALLRLRLAQPALACHGERALLRDPALGKVIAGLRILDPEPPQRMPIAVPQPGLGGLAARIAHLDALRAEDAVASLRRQSALFADGVDLQAFQAAWQLTTPAMDSVIERAQAMRAERAGRARLLSEPAVRACAETIGATLDAAHREQPTQLGLAWRAVAATLGRSPDDLTAATALNRLIAARQVRRHGALLHRPAHSPALADRDRADWQRMRGAIIAAGLRPPRVHELAQLLGVTPEHVNEVLDRVCASGRAWRVAPNRCFLAGQLRALAQQARALSQGHAGGRFSAAQFKDTSGVGRNLAIEVLEFFDRHHVTRRVGDTRVMSGDATELFADHPEDAGTETAPAAALQQAPADG